MPDRLKVLLRHLAPERGYVSMLFILVALTSILVAAAPRFYTKVLDDELTERIAAMPAIQRNITVNVQGFIHSEPDQTILETLDRRGVAFLRGLDPELQAIIKGFNYVVYGPEVSVLTNVSGIDTPQPTRFQLLFQGRIDDQITYIEGTGPGSQDEMLVSGLSEYLEVGETATLQVTQVAISETSAREMGWNTGDAIVVRNENTGSLWVIVLSGIFQINDPDEPFWVTAGNLESPRFSSQQSGNGEQILVTGIAAAEANTFLIEASRPYDWRYQWTYAVDPAAINTDNLSQVNTSSRLLQLNLGPYEALAQVPHTRVRISNEISQELAVFPQTTQLALAVMTVMTIATLATALGSIIVAGGLIAQRRRAAVILIRSRGAGASSLLFAQVVEGFLIASPATLVGLVIAWLSIQSRWSSWSVIGIAGCILLTIVCLVASAYHNFFAELGQLLGRSEPESSLQRIRLTIEVTVILLATTGVYLLRQRGFESSGDAGFDPSLAAVPVLLAIAIGVVVTRLYPFLLQPLIHNSKRFRGIVLSTAIRRSVRQESAIRFPMLVMIIATGITSFAVTINAALDEHYHDISWRLVGADHRVEGSAARLIDPLGIPGITNFAAVDIYPGDPGTIVALDTESYKEITLGTPADIGIPNTMLRNGSNDSIPALVSGDWPYGQSVKALVGTSIRVTPRAPLNADPISFEIVGIVDAFPLDELSGPFLIVPRDRLHANQPILAPRVSALFLGGPDATSDNLRQAIDEAILDTQAMSVSATVVSRQQERETMSHASLTNGVRRALATGSVIALGFALLTLVVSLTLTSLARSRETAYLRTVGLAPRQVDGLLIAEYAPPILVASIVGTLFGIGMVMLIEPSIPLGTLSGGNANLPTTMLRVQVLIPPTVLIVSALASTAICAACIRKAKLASMLRPGGGTSAE